MPRSVWKSPSISFLTALFSLSFLVSVPGLLPILPLRTARGCKPCGEPTLAALLSKADVVAVAKVVKVSVVPRAKAQPSEEPGRDVRWFVAVERRMKGNPSPVLTVKHGDVPPCISARVPEPGRYVMLLYFQEGQYIPLNYCDQPLFPIDAQDRVTLTPAMAKELDAASEHVPLQRVVDWVTKRVTQAPQKER